MRNRSVAVAVVVALVATAGWWFGLYSPKDEQLVAVEQEIDTLLARQQQLRNELTQLRQVQADEEDIRAALDRLVDYVPEGTDEPELVRQLQAAADSAGVVISSLTFGAPAPLVEAPAAPSPERTLAGIPLTVVLDGSYFQVVDFFRRLEVDSSRAVLVESVSMAESENGFPELTTTWAGEVFAEVPVVMPEAVTPTTPPDGGTEDTSDPADADATATGGQA